MNRSNQNVVDRVAERIEKHRNFNSKVQQNVSYSFADTIAERKYSKTIRDNNGKIIRGYEGIDMKEVYLKKPLMYKILKILLDIVISALGLAVLSPVFLVMAIVIKLEDGGSVLFLASGIRNGQ